MTRYNLLLIDTAAPDIMRQFQIALLSMNPVSLSLICRRYVWTSVMLITLVHGFLNLCKRDLCRVRSILGAIFQTLDGLGKLVADCFCPQSSIPSSKRAGFGFVSPKLDPMYWSISLADDLPWSRFKISFIIDLGPPATKRT